MVAAQLLMMKQGKAVQEAAFNANRAKMMESVSMLFNRMYEGDTKRPGFGGPGSIFGLEDPEFFIKPPPPDFLEGLSKDDFTNSFGKFLL